MAEVTGPIVPLSEVSTGDLVAAVEEATTWIRKAHEVVRRDIMLRGPLTELTMIDNRIADAQLDFRKGVTLKLTGPALSSVPVPSRRPGVLKPRRRAAGKHAAGRGGTVTWLPSATPPDPDA